MQDPWQHRITPNAMEELMQDVCPGMHSAALLKVLHEGDVY